jgi:hypothetical protein
MMDGHNLWFLKPTAANRGRGVHVFDTIEKLQKLMSDLSSGKTEKLVVDGSESDGEDEADPKDPKYQIKATNFVI